MQNELKKLESPRRCELKVFPGQDCPCLATWAIGEVAICLEHLEAMAEMNSDNAEFLQPALEGTN
jgi:hypothetical protein